MSNRTRACKFCKEKSIAANGIIVGMSFFCGYTCATKHGIALAEKANKKKLAKLNREKLEHEKAYRQATRERKQKLKTMAQLKAEAQTWFNKFIRLSDPYQECCSCDRSAEEIERNDGWKPGGCWDAGHFHSRGARPELRYVEDNCWRQCKSCNAGAGKYARKGHTVSAAYREKLIDRIGIDRVEALDLDLGPINWTREDILNITNMYKAKCKELT